MNYRKLATIILWMMLPPTNTMPQSYQYAREVGEMQQKALELSKGTLGKTAEACNM
jgi:hypothetical protein